MSQAPQNADSPDGEAPCMRLSPHLSLIPVPLSHCLASLHLHSDLHRTPEWLQTFVS